MKKPIILVTGSNGQLGQELAKRADRHEGFEFAFTDRNNLPLDDLQQLSNYISDLKPAFIINCAAYTAVDKAETDTEMANQVNAIAVGEMARLAKQLGARFIHFSTDYVFDGTSPVPYIETDQTSPVNAYGHTKREGEILCLEKNGEAVIIRTSWVYSAFGNNFVKTIIRLMKERNELNVVNDQVGSPTYAGNLAEATLKIIQSPWQPGIYHYSDEGRISWYEFALAIRDLIGSSCAVHPIPSSKYPTPAKRPSFSLLNTGKIRDVYGVQVHYWKNSLQDCIKEVGVLATPQ